MATKTPDYLPSIGRLLGFASAATTTLASRRLQKHGLTLRQWIVLTALWREPILSESELVAYCRTSPSALNRLLDRMEQKDLVVRLPDPEDGRRVLVTLGRAAKREANTLRFYEEINDVLLEGFTPKEVRHVQRYLERIVENVEQSLHEG
jgi:DNA-binding MarR family transcriptional regulator